MNSKEYKKFSQTQAVGCVASAMICDIILYTSLLPYFGVLVTGFFTENHTFNPKTELLMCVVITFCLVYTGFYIFGEVTFWRHLFLFDDFYCRLLQVRDLINTCTIVLCLICIASTVELMMQDKEMKRTYLGEGAGYVFMASISINLPSKFGMRLPHKATLLDPNFGENERYIHGATFILYWAMLAACIAKIMYFNSMWTYMRALKILVRLHPKFDVVEYDEKDPKRRRSSVISRD